jgi:hypothetical protein
VHEKADKSPGQQLPQGFKPKSEPFLMMTSQIYIKEVLRMKHDNRTGLGRPALAIKTLIAGVAMSALLGFSLNAQAQTCTIANWDVATNLANANSGTQGTNNRRYGGPCGLRVPVDGTARYLTDNSPAAESTYIARFYTFLNNAGSNQAIIFSADQSGTDQLQVWYNVPAAGDLTLRVYENGGGFVDLTHAGVGSGWHSVEVVWESSATAEIRFAVNSDDPLNDATVTADTSTISLTAAHLGNVNGVAGPGSIDFDDFDSRRLSRPGRLLRGDANNDGQISSADILSTRIEILSGTNFASGQPDCNEDGQITSSDILCQRILILSAE